MDKSAWDGPKWGPRGLFPANPDLADILGNMDLDFDNFHSLYFLNSEFLDFQVPRFPKSGPWLGLGRSRLGLSHLWGITVKCNAALDASAQLRA